MMLERKCDECGDSFNTGQKYRYCKECRKLILKQLREDGYLQSTGDAHVGMRRSSESKENTYETKHGTGHG